MSLEYIARAIEVVITDSDPHASLFHAICTKRNTAQHTFFAESTVVIVNQEQARCGIACHINIRPAIVVKVSRNDGHAIAFVQLSNASSLADIGKGPIPVIAIQGMPPCGKSAWSTLDRNSLPIAVAVCDRLGNTLNIKFQIIGDEHTEV